MTQVAAFRGVGDTVLWTNPAGGASIDITVDSVVPLGNTFGIIVGNPAGVPKTVFAVADVAELALRGRFVVPKKSADTFVAGAKAYWDATNHRITSTVSAGKCIGVTVSAQINGDVTAEIILNHPVAI